MALRGLAATRAAVGLCRIAASASSSLPSAAAGGRRERELPFALVAERGMVVGGHRGMGMNAVGAPPGAPVGAARERENTLLSFGHAAAQRRRRLRRVRRAGACLGVSFGTLFGFGLEVAVTPQHCDARMVIAVVRSIKNVGGWALPGPCRNNGNACSSGCNLPLPPNFVANFMTILHLGLGTWMLCSTWLQCVTHIYAKISG